MKKNIVLFCLLLCLCLCFTSCQNQLPPDSLDIVPARNNNTPESKVPGSNSGINKVLHTSDAPYILPSGSNSEDSGGYEELIEYAYDAYSIIILDLLVGDKAVDDYVENVLKNMDAQEFMNAPQLYHTVHHFNIDLEDLLEANEIMSEYRGSDYDENLLRAMYLPYEDMLAATMTPQGAYLNGNVYNIHTLNALFENDKEAFSLISLDELVAFQERLEEEGVDYGFNQDMVDFANQNCPPAEASNLEEENPLSPSADDAESEQQELPDGQPQELSIVK